MFVFGDFDSSSVAGLLATLKAWPTPPTSVDTLDVPGIDGVFFAAASRQSAEFVFDVFVEQDTPEGALGVRDALVAACSPSAGVQPLTPELADGWAWGAVAAAVSEFTRGLWVRGMACQLRGEVRFTCPDPYGYASPDEAASGPSPVTITRAKGNVRSFPRVEVTGAFTGVTVTIGGQPVTVADVAVAAGQKLVLDYALLEFAVWNTAGTVKVAHATPGMSTFDRFSLPLGPTTVSAVATGGGSVTGLTVFANSRRA